MKYSPKLKKAMAEIQAIAEKYDIAAVVILHEPRFSEYWLGVQPTYSAVKIEGNTLRLRCKRSDFKSENEFINMLRNTANMGELLFTTTANAAMSLDTVNEAIKAHIDVDHGDAEHTPQFSIDN